MDWERVLRIMVMGVLILSGIAFAKYPITLWLREFS
jgi:hypothetical protein